MCLVKLVWTLLGAMISGQQYFNSGSTRALYRSNISHLTKVSKTLHIQHQPPAATHGTHIQWVRYSGNAIAILHLNLPMAAQVKDKYRRTEQGLCLEVIYRLFQIKVY